ncbi:MAG: ParA family protein, partial [Pseudomonadota bacterium]
AAALAGRGGRVGLADADAQQSALGWLGLRPADLPPIAGLSWAKAGRIGAHPKKLDWLVIDAPGALKGARAEALIAEAKAIVTPFQPGLFDRASTERFLAEIEEIKRIAKGKVGVHLVANRFRGGVRQAEAVAETAAALNRAVTATIPERAAYASLAATGMTVFDSTRTAHRRLCGPWQPLLDAFAGYTDAARVPAG